MLGKSFVYVSVKDCWYGATDWERETSDMACCCTEGFREVFRKGTSILLLSPLFLLFSENVTDLYITSIAVCVIMILQ